MSNSALNAHIIFGSPLGDDPDLWQLADWAGDLLISTSSKQKEQIELLENICAYLCTENPTEVQRKSALVECNELLDSLRDVEIF